MWHFFLSLARIVCQVFSSSFRLYCNQESNHRRFRLFIYLWDRRNWVEFNEQSQISEEKSFVGNCERTSSSRKCRNVNDWDENGILNLYYLLQPRPRSTIPLSFFYVPLKPTERQSWRGSRQTGFRDTVNNVPSPTLTSCLRLHSISPWNDCVWPLEKMNKYVQSKPEKYNCRDIRLPYLTSVCVCVCVCVSYCALMFACPEGSYLRLLWSRGMCVILVEVKSNIRLVTAGEKKKTGSFAPFFPSFFSVSLSPSLHVCVSPTAAKPRTPRCLMFYRVLNAVCLSEIKAPLIGIVL